MTDSRLANRKEISKVIYNDRFGYAVAYYTPHMRDPALEIIERSKKYNLPERKRYKPEPSRDWRKRETPSEFLERKDLERKFEAMHDTTEKAKELFRKARDFDYNRHEMLFPRYKNIVHGRTVDDTIERVNDIYEKYLKRSGPAKEVTEEEETSAEAKTFEKMDLKPNTLIKDIHQTCEHKIVKRREDALRDNKSYCDSVDAMLKRINALSSAFKDEKDDDDY